MPAVNGIQEIDVSVLPSYMTEKLSPEPASAPREAPPPPAISEDPWGWLKRLGKDGVRLTLGAWDKASQYKTLLDYYFYSGELKEAFEARHAPYDLQRYVYDARGRAILPNPDALARQEGGAVARTPQVNNVYDYSGFIFDFFKEHLGFVIPQPLLQVVNYNDNELAYGFGNAFFNPMEMGLNIMVYGTGDGRYFKSFDSDITVIAHELAHNFVTSKFGDKFTELGRHYGQPGALNEHIADVIAKCVEAKYNGWDDLVEHWFIGANLMVNPNFALRDMYDPGSAYNDPVLGKDPQPDHMRDFVVTGNDKGGVHLNCGIMNRLFALFCHEVGGAVYDTPLNVWLKAMSAVGVNPSFHDFSQALRYSARLYNVEEEFLRASAQVGVLDYVVVDGAVRRADDLSDPSGETVLSGKGSELMDCSASCSAP